MVFFRKLRFPETEKEHEFVRSRMKPLVKHMQLGAIFAVVVAVIDGVLILTGGNFVRLHALPAMFKVIVDGFALCVCVSVFLYLRKRASLLFDSEVDVLKTTLRPDQLEKLAIALSLFGVFFNCASNRFRVALMLGVDPQDAWNTSICNFTDSNFVLGLDTVVTAVAVFLPIRMHLLPVVPVMAVVSFVSTSVAIGSPETLSKQVMNVLWLCLLGCFVLIGCHANEARERERFDETFTARKEMVTERVARYDLERQIEKSICFSGAGHSQAEIPMPSCSASGAAPSGDRLPRTGSHSAETFSLSDLTSGTLNLTEGEPSIQAAVVGNLSTATATSSVGHAAQMDNSIQKQSAQPNLNMISSSGFTSQHNTRSPKQSSSEATQTVAPVLMDKALDPLLSWDGTSWKCNRCSKPPQMPDQGTSGCRSNRLAPPHSGVNQKPSRGKGNSSCFARSCMSNITGIGYLSSFKTTPTLTKEAMLFEIMKGWNCVRLSHACCPWHASLSDLKMMVKLLQKHDCQPLWSCYSHAQCMSCGVMIDESPGDDHECNWCEGAVTAGDRNSSPESASSLSLDSAEANGSHNVFQNSNDIVHYRELLSL